MKLLSIYLGSMNDFTRQFKNNEVLYNQARAYWNKLDDMAFLFILFSILVGAGMAYLYYGPYNNKAGRHYKPQYWLWHLVFTFIISLFLTGLVCGIFAYPKLDGTIGLLIRIAFVNAICASLIYFFISVVCCNCRNLSTNAYRYFCPPKNKS